MKEFSFKPSDDYNGLLKQANAMAMVIKSMEKQRAFQNVKIGDMARELAQQGFEEINAQRETNALLTEQIESLELRLAEYENPKNWTRGFDWEGKLINEHALYKPKLRNA